ncbi:MAG: 3-keto-disaccharide hydrolase [Planctomycetota bacterium]|jgi:hypothetical protein
MGKIVLISVLGLVFLSGCNGGLENGDWMPLFNGADLSGWKASENQGSFKVEDGAIVVYGKRSHLFYVGPVGNANFKNFEFSAQVMTTPGSNSGIYFHTEYQQEGWPKKGYESQVNISHSDPQKSGGLYDAATVSDPPARDNEWYTQYIKVEGKSVIVKINGQEVVNYIEADDVNFEGWPGRRLSSGTFAIQAHDPKSLVYIKDIKVKMLKWVCRL